MALVVADRIKETSTTSGTGTLTLAGASAGFRSFADIGNGNTTYYSIVDSAANTWEVGIGTYTASGTTLSRDTVLSNSSGTTSPINFSANTKDVFVTYPADKALYYQDVGGVVVSENSSSTALRITQTGAGNALVVEDAANPDSTPFVIDSSGKTIVGYTTALGSRISAATITPVLQTVATTYSNASIGQWGFNTAAYHVFSRSASAIIGTNSPISSGDIIGAIEFTGDDGTNFTSAARIFAAVDGTPGTDDMPGRLVFSTTADGASAPTERMRIGSSGTVGFGSANSANYTVRTGKDVTGGTTAGNFYANGLTQPDVTSTSYGYLSQSNTAASAFTLSAQYGFRAIQGTFGAGSTVTNQYGFGADNSLIGATNNYGFYSNIPSGTGRWNFYANGTASNYFGGNTIVQVTDNTNAALRVTQLGTGDAFVVEDSTNPDSTPFVINASGNVGVGVSPSNNYKLEVSGTAAAKQVAATNGIFVNSNTISEDYVIPTGYNAMSAGAITINSGITVTVPSDSSWAIV